MGPRPTKSYMVPSDLQIPVWPMQGIQQVRQGRAVQTRQYGYRLFYGSTNISILNSDSIFYVYIYIAKYYAIDHFQHKAKNS